MKETLPTWSKGYDDSEITIEGVKISPYVKPVIIAEIGINHNGSIDDAKKLADLAAENGADIIKTQIHIAKSEMSDNAKKIVPSHCENSIYNIIENLSLSLDEEVELFNHIKGNGSVYLATPFSHDAADFLLDLGVSCFKVGSGEFNNLPLIDRILSKEKVSIIASTGMQSLEDVKCVYDHIKKQTENIVLMHTTNLYPTPNELVRLEGIREIMNTCRTLNVGLSDHTTANFAAYGAMALGATVIERHFTDSKDRKGPDIENSMTPDELRELAYAADIYKDLRWGSKVNLLPEEDNTRAFAFASVVTKRTIKKGQIIGEQDITTKRPGDGEIPAKSYSLLIGKRAERDLDGNYQLEWKDVR